MLKCGVNNEKMKNELKKELDCFRELCRFVGYDVPVYLCGEPSTLSEVACMQVGENEDYTYMADMVRNDDGELLMVCFDKVICNS